MERPCVRWDFPDARKNLPGAAVIRGCNGWPISLSQ
jgi:hypothetical protein